jgi:intein/homing endonuclease
MIMLNTLERGKIHAGERGLQLLAKQAVDSLEKGFIELVTNVDESYYRLEKKGEVVSGKIEISIDRHTRTKPTTIEVLDR